MLTLAQKMTAFVLVATNPGLSLGAVKSKAAGYRQPLALEGLSGGVTAPVLYLQKTFGNSLAQRALDKYH